MFKAYAGIPNYNYGCRNMRERDIFLHTCASTGTICQRILINERKRVARDFLGVVGPFHECTRLSATHSNTPASTLR